MQFAILFKSEGNIANCDQKCDDENSHKTDCEQVICEKVLFPKDNALCLEKSAVVISQKSNVLVQETTSAKKPLSHRQDSFDSKLV